MSRSAIRVFVFDFDGTLIDSNAGKRQAFFDIIGDNPRRKEFLESVLSEIGEESRYVILDEILRRDDPGSNEAGRRNEVHALAREYGERVLEVAKSCPEKPFAREILEELGTRVPVFLSSTTPEECLREIVAHRGWSRYFQGIHGHPHRKPDTLRRIIAATGTAPNEVLVVGDGKSDREAAREAGTAFFSVDADDSLARLLETHAARYHSTC